MACNGLGWRDGSVPIVAVTVLKSMSYNGCSTKGATMTKGATTGMMMAAPAGATGTVVAGMARVHNFKN